MEDGNGNVVFTSNGEFEDSESQAFCADGTGCSLTATFTIVDDSENDNGSILIMDGRIQITFTNNLLVEL